MNRPDRRRTGVEGLVQKAINAHRAGRLAEAEMLYRRAIERTPNHPGALNNLGLIYRARGEAGPAEAAFRAALARQPDFAEAHYNRGNALTDLGRGVEAAASYRSALAHRPSYADAWFNLGNRLREADDASGAEHAWLRAVALRPDHAQAQLHLGNALLGQGRAAEALARYELAIALRPDWPIAHSNRGGALDALGKPGLALPAYEHAATLDPANAEAHFNAATALRALGRLREAIDRLQRALAVRPGYERAKALLLLLYLEACDWPAARALAPIVDSDTRAALRAGTKTPESPLGSCWRADDPALHRAVAQSWAHDLASKIHPLPVANADSKGVRHRLRIGYLSCAFRRHPIAQVMGPVFAAHDHSRIEVVAYGYGIDDASAERQAIAMAVDRFVDVAGLGDSAAAARIRADNVDILVDLNLWADDARPAISAHRPAPVQVAWGGVPATSGAPYFDYAIVDRIIVPPERAGDWIEPLVVMPHSFIPSDGRQPIETAGVSRSDQGLPEDAVVLASFNQSYKIDETLWFTWMDILNAVPGSVLWLGRVNDLARGNLLQAARKCGVASHRIVFAERAPGRSRHLARLALADIALDTLTYNGHMTSNDMLLAGVPLLTCPGRSFAARVGASLLTSAGLHDLIMPDLDAYAARAIELANDRAARAALRDRIARARVSAPLFDVTRFARGLERAYEAMWRRYVAGEPAAPIDLR